jgi:NTE family protein
MGSYLVDGGVLSPVPVRQCRELGADIVIGIRLTAKDTAPRDQLTRKPGRPFAMETMLQTFEIMLNRISEVSSELADVNIEVAIEGGGGLRDFKREREMADAGYRAAMAAAPSIRSALKSTTAAT